MAQTTTAAGPVEGMEASPHAATQPASAGYQRAERPPMGVLTQGILADRGLLGPLLRPAQRLLGRPRPERIGCRSSVGTSLCGLGDDTEGVAWRVDAVVFLGEVKVPVGVEVAVADQGA